MLLSTNRSSNNTNNSTMMSTATTSPVFSNLAQEFYMAKICQNMPKSHKIAFSHFNPDKLNQAAPSLSQKLWEKHVQFCVLNK